MNQLIVELDDRTLRRLNEAAPPKDRKRSEFVREAIRKALDAHLGEQMQRAYRAVPQETGETDLDAETWVPVRFSGKKRGKSR